MLVPLAGCGHEGVLHAAGPVAEIQRSALDETLLIMLAVLIPIFVGLPLVLWRYRRKRKDQGGAYRPDWTFSWPLEFAIWGGPAVIVVLLAVLTWNATHAASPWHPVADSDDRPPLEIQVIALDWKFVFIDRADGVATVNTLVVPAGRAVRLSMTSDATMQALTIPRLGGQIYAMAGMVTRLNLRADRPGIYHGRNTQYNGTGFAKDAFSVRALPPAAFAAWKARAVRAAPLTRAAYARLSRKGTIRVPQVYSAPTRDLFADVLARYAMKNAAQPRLSAATPSPETAFGKDR